MGYFSCVKLYQVLEPVGIYCDVLISEIWKFYDFNILMLLKIFIYKDLVILNYLFSI